MRNQLSEVHIRIFKELPKYLKPADELKRQPLGDNNGRRNGADSADQGTLFAISL